MSEESTQTRVPDEALKVQKQFKAFALSCLAFWIMFQVIETVAGGRISGTNSVTYLIVNATRVFLPWPAIMLGCTSSRWLVRIPLACLALFLCFGLYMEITVGNSFNYSREMSQYELLSTQLLDQRTAIAKYRFNPGAFSSFREITRRETIVGPGLIFVRVIKDTRE